MKYVVNRIARAAACLLAILALVSCGQTAGLASLACGTSRSVALPVTMHGKAALVAITVPGGSAVLMLDTGSDITNFTRAAALRLGFPQDPLHKLPGQTVGGTVQDDVGLVTNLQAGGVLVQSMPVAVTETSPAEGVLGLDILQRFDVDFDLAHGRVTLYPGGLCPGQSPPWQGRFQEIAVRRSVTGRALDGTKATKPYLMLPAALNGQPTEAMLDTGALLTGLVNPAFAVEVGISPSQLLRDPQAIAGGFGPLAPLRMHRFDTLDLGTERLLHPVLAVGGSAARFPLVLGMDVFLSHRIWFSFATDRVFLQTLPDRGAHTATP